MPLVLRLIPNEKVIINGVVVENGGGDATLLIRNHGNILRGKEILDVAEATTPALRLYYALQCLYLFPDKTELYAQALEGFLADFRRAAPSAAPLIGEIADQAANGSIYQALKATKRLIEYEKEILQHVPQGADEPVQ
ncbi:MAG: flagellar biosynthesis repressor FlbT [Pseudomonadota bacterium]